MALHEGDTRRAFDSHEFLGLFDMSEAATYSTIVTLRNGRRIEIRALRPADRDEFVAAAGRTSDRSLYFRFFRARRVFTEKEVSSFVDVDFVKHVALVAITENRDRPMIVGAGRYIVAAPRQAEVAFAVADDHQGQGVGAALVHHLAAVAQRAGLTELVADVLPDNVPMLKVFEKSGFPLTVKWARGVVHITLRLCHGNELATQSVDGK